MRHLTESLGGTLEAVYFAFGDLEAFVIMEYPDNVTAIADSLIAQATGAVKGKTAVLITAEEIDRATEAAKAVRAAYRPPGQ